MAIIINFKYHHPLMIKYLSLDPKKIIAGTVCDIANSMKFITRAYIKLQRNIYYIYNINLKGILMFGVPLYFHF